LTKINICTIGLENYTYFCAQNNNKKQHIMRLFLSHRTTVTQTKTVFRQLHILSGRNSCTVSFIKNAYLSVLKIIPLNHYIMNINKFLPTFVTGDFAINERRLIGRKKYLREMSELLRLLTLGMF
jgi:hypothetical protein